MQNEMKLIRKSEHKTSNWSGGTTTQLYIYPKESEYSKLDFLFRISSAKVEVDESIFTYLAGINRKIMIIDGELVLNHEGHHTKKLSKFDKDSFSGEWTTKSYGKVTDFNLMMNKNCYGDLEHIKIDSINSKCIKLIDKDKEHNKEASVLYCVNGSVNIELEEKVDLYEGDLFVIIADKKNNINNINIVNNLKEESNIIISKIYFDIIK